MEEKFKREGDDDEDSSSDEEEDENGFLATEDLDAQISATLQAIRSKDPRVYDENTTFYKPDDEAAPAEKGEKAEKPVFLKDYHRDRFMKGDIGASDDEEEEIPQTYAQEQEDLKKSIMSEINKAGDDEDSGSEDDFLKPKEAVRAKVSKETGAHAVHPSRAAGLKVSELDVENADRDPETYLSNFMASRAWVEEGESKWKAFDSEDEDEAERAEEWEQAYNLRFEDPEKSNEVLRSYARDLANSKSVRRDEKSGRKRKREEERERKDEERRERQEEKARLRKLKLEETEKRLQKIKQAAGAVGKELTNQDWLKFLDDAWEDDAWEEEMQKRFGEEYYAMDDDEAAAANSDEDVDMDSKKKSKVKKPKWDDDIDINDLVPDFEADANEKFSLSDNEDDAEPAEDNADDDDDEEAGASTKKIKPADRKRARLDSQKQARKERAQLEALVDSKMNMDVDVPSGHQVFRYRETSPQSFGMTARDILLAPSDQVLNEFAGLKKFATFRDEEKKRKDKKRLGKKARLREWRRGVFGEQYEHDGPTYGFEKFAGAERGVDEEAPKPAVDEEGNVIEGGKKKRRRSKKKSATAA